MRAFYFGVWSTLGHELRDQAGRVQYDYDHPMMPWRTWEIDGRLQPHRSKCSRQNYCGCGDLPEGVALLHRRDGWTALSFWDRSLDQRPASNSNFFFEGDHSFHEMIDLASQHFPHIMMRFKFRIILGEKNETAAPG